MQYKNKTNKQKDIQSPVVSVGRANKTASKKNVVETPAGTFPLKRQSGARRCTQSIAPTSTVPPLNWKHDLMFSEKPNAWFCCVCSTNRDSGCDCGPQRLSSRMNCGYSSCRRSNCCSGSGFGSCWCCGSGCDCGCGWRGCSRTTRWWTDCWRKDWVGSKGWVASWHCEEPKGYMVWN